MNAIDRQQQQDQLNPSPSDVVLDAVFQMGSSHSITAHSVMSNESDIHLPPSDPGLSLAEFCLGGEDASHLALPQSMAVETAVGIQLPPDVDEGLEEPQSTRCG